MCASSILDDPNDSNTSGLFKIKVKKSVKVSWTKKSLNCPQEAPEYIHRSFCKFQTVLRCKLDDECVKSV